jgi:glycosyltransferase involved in cell wall biosynthesis
MARILMIVGYLSEDPRSGGGDLISFRLAQALERMGHQIDYRALLPLSTPPRDHPQMVRFRSGSAVRDIIESLRERHKAYDLVHIQEGNKTVGACLGFSLRRKGVPMVLGYYAPEAYRIPRSLAEIAKTFATRRADLVFALSHYSRHNIASAYGVPLSKIEVTYGGVDSEFFSESHESREPPHTLLFVGRLDGPGRQKGLDTLLDAIPLISKNQEVRLDVIGTGPGEVAFRRQTARLKINDRVRFFGFIPHVDLPKYYKNASLLVLPSRRESFGLVLAEAMASSRPVVASRVGAIPEVVEDGVTGLLIPPDDPNACAAAITSLLDNPDRMWEMGKRGQERARACFTWEKVAERVSAGYNKLLEESR